jgi:hypothetical protein
VRELRKVLVKHEESALLKKIITNTFCRLYQNQKYFLETFSCSLNIKKNLVLKVKKKIILIYLYLQIVSSICWTILNKIEF